MTLPQGAHAVLFLDATLWCDFGSAWQGGALAAVVVLVAAVPVGLVALTAAAHRQRRHTASSWAPAVYRQLSGAYRVRWYEAALLLQPLALALLLALAPASAPVLRSVAATDVCAAALLLHMACSGGLVI